MKFLLTLSIASLVLLFTPIASHAQQVKIASLDMEKIFNDYFKTKKAQADLKDKATVFDKELRDREAELTKMREDCRKLKEEAENPAFTDEKKAEKRKILEEKVSAGQLLYQQLQDTRAKYKADWDKEQAKLRNSIVDEIVKVVQDKAKKEGFSLVVDKTGLTLSGVSPFIFVQDTLDITAETLKALNAAAPPEGASTPAAPAAEKKDKKP